VKPVSIVLTLMFIVAAIAPALAGQGEAGRRSYAALSMPGDTCGPAACRVPERAASGVQVAAVKCSAGFWCCRHDFVKKVCVKCCKKG
jgi:hypothetical protein